VLLNVVFINNINKTKKETAQVTVQHNNNIFCSTVALICNAQIYGFCMKEMCGLT